MKKLSVRTFHMYRMLISYGNLFKIVPVQIFISSILIILSEEIMESSGMRIFSFHLGRENPMPIHNYNFFIIAISILIDPFIETILYQKLFFWVICEKFKIKSYAYIFISSVLFGLSHNYDVSYVIRAIILGLVFSYTFYLRYISKMHPIKSTYVLHASWNATAYASSYFSNM